MLLLARALNPSSEFAMASDELDESSGVLIKQRKLAEILEMISAAQSIHKTVLNLPHEIPNNADADTKDDLQQLEYGNKIAILGGDYLLANACVGLADLRNTYIVEMMAIAIGEFTQSEFLGKRDVQGRLVPDQESIQLKAWLHRNKMASGSLLASGFKGSAMLSNHSDTVRLKLK
jgi:decaprenyl-diphosphate synthase subunit 2